MIPKTSRLKTPTRDAAGWAFLRPFDTSSAHAAAAPFPARCTARITPMSRKPGRRRLQGAC